MFNGGFLMTLSFENTKKEGMFPYLQEAYNTICTVHRIREIKRSIPFTYLIKTTIKVKNENKNKNKMNCL